MGASDDTLTCGICGELGGISSDNKTRTSCAQKVELSKKDGACDNTNNMSNNTDGIGTDVSKELDSAGTSAAFTFLSPGSAKSEDKTKSNTKINETFHFGRSNPVSSSLLDKIAKDVSSKMGVSNDNDKLCQDPPPPPPPKKECTMSSIANDNSMSICAACGKSGDHLKACTACRLVKYCNRNCQISHRPKHKKECRKRAAELKHAKDISEGISNVLISGQKRMRQRAAELQRSMDNRTNVKNISEGIGSINISDSLSASTTAADKKASTSYEQNFISDDKLFQDPVAPKLECPICTLPMPYAASIWKGETIYQPCCGKMLCLGCVAASYEEMKKGNMKNGCTFCRLPINITDKERLKRLEKRMKLNDAEAVYLMALFYNNGSFGLSKDSVKAIELWNKAADLGSVSAHYSSGIMYNVGDGVKKNVCKSMYHWKLAAIGGHEMARHNLGCIQYNIGVMDRAMKHFLIAARAGLDEALKEVGKGYKAGHVTKDEYANALRAHQKTRDEMKSEQRDKAAQRYPNKK